MNDGCASDGRDVVPKQSDKDLFRDTPVRYLGYANEVGEAFRSLVHINVVRFSYAVASSYVVSDAIHKGHQVSEHTWPAGQKNKKIAQAVVDTIVWQGLASVAVPGFTINRLCYFAGILLNRVLPKLPLPMKKFTVTVIGLGAIPLIIKPIDNSVDYVMNNSVRRWYHIGPVLQQEIVHHHRND